MITNLESHLMRRDPGSYALILKAPETGTAQIGRLGAIEFRGDWFVYVGSAFGPGGVEARVGHHRRPKRSCHWHIDYLLREVRIEEVWYTHDPVKREEEWAEAFRTDPLASNPLRRFGAGDCGCDGHLFRLAERPAVERLTARLRELGTGGYDVHVG